jgi:hypothetical protein
LFAEGEVVQGVHGRGCATDSEEAVVGAQDRGCGGQVNLSVEHDIRREKALEANGENLPVV